MNEYETTFSQVGVNQGFGGLAWILLFMSEACLSRSV